MYWCHKEKITSYLKNKRGTDFEIFLTNSFYMIGYLDNDDNLNTSKTTYDSGEYKSELMTSISKDGLNNSIEKFKMLMSNNTPYYLYVLNQDGTRDVKLKFYSTEWLDIDIGTQAYTDENVTIDFKISFSPESTRYNCLLL